MTPDEAYMRLQEIINDAGLDVSFGMSQRILAYHDIGDRSITVDNAVYVRDWVFTHPGEDIYAAASRYANCLSRTQYYDLSMVDGDPILGGLVIYNAGSLKPPGDPWWVRWQGNVNNYRWALQEAQNMIDPEFENWLELYRNAHGGHGPAAWEYRKHFVAITGEIPTEEDKQAIQTDLDAINAQYEMIMNR